MENRESRYVPTKKGSVKAIIESRRRTYGTFTEIEEYAVRGFSSVRYNHPKGEVEFICEEEDGKLRRETISVTNPLLLQFLPTHFGIQVDEEEVEAEAEEDVKSKLDKLGYIH